MPTRTGASSNRHLDPLQLKSDIITGARKTLPLRPCRCGPLLAARCSRRGLRLCFRASLFPPDQTARAPGPR
jgi:hypothetical protein